MKAYNKYLYIGAVVLTVGLSSCEKWLDVAPQTQIEADRVFEKESGFQDALTGIYVKMTSESLYGRELTFGMVDGLGAQFNGQTSANQYYSTVNYDYNQENFIAKSEALFKESYNTIANINFLIQKLNEKGSDMFSGANFHTIRGEAYGLRAFLHFDLLRLYGSAIASKGETELAIPYMDAVGTLPQERLSTRAALNKVIADLELAEKELFGSDPIIPANSENASTYLRDRNLKFNYYAVKVLQARVLLYAGDKVRALEAAKEVIESNVFEWTPSSEIATTVEGSRNKIFTQELIFSLSINNLSTITSPFYDVAVSGNLLSRENSQYLTLFANQDDYRFQYLTSEFKEGVINKRFSSKFYNGASSTITNRMPLIRKSELYYIAAECLAESDRAESIEYLNEVRQRRNLLEGLSSALTTDQIETEIRMEYRREFISEGQIFYYYKRKNAARLDDLIILMNDDTYVLPLPDREIFYGQ